MFMKKILLKKRNGVGGYRQYNLEDIISFSKIESEKKIGCKRVFHDVSLKKWRMTVQLDQDRRWFLSVFFMEDGGFDMFSLDEETASDSHYEFEDEAAIRKMLYMQGDEERYLDEIFVRCIAEYGGNNLVDLLKPFLTGQYHYS